VNVIENQPSPELSWDSDQRTIEPKTTDIELQSLYEYMNYVDSNSEYENCVFIKQFTDDPMNLGPPAFGTTTKHYLQQLNNYIKSFNKIEEIRCQEQNITIE
jgi:cytochrome c1